MATTERPTRTLAAFAAGLALVFGAAYGVGRAFPDHTPMDHMEHTDGTHEGTHTTETTP